MKIGRILVVLLVFAGIGALVIYMRGMSAGGDRVVTVKGFPAEVEALNARFTLEVVDRQSCGPGMVRIVIGYDDVNSEHYNIELGRTRVKWYGGERDEHISGSSRPSDRSNAEIFCSIPPGTKRITVCQECILRRRGALFEFKDIKMSDLPKTVKCGDAQVTLKSARLIKYSGEPSWQDCESGYIYSTRHTLKPGDQCFRIDIDARYPESFTHGRDHQFIDLIDQSGNRHEEVSSVRYEGFAGWESRHPNLSVTDVKTTPEKIVTAHERYVYKPIEPAPTVFSFRTAGFLAPGPKDVAYITFKDVPVP